MNIRELPRSAVTSYLRLARTPFDAATRLLPGNGSGPRPAAKLTVDRVDATARSVAASILRDPQLREDAQRRRAALQERAQAVRLREQAQERKAEAEASEEQRHEQARSRRQRADAEAGDRRRQAQTRKQRDQKQARATAQRRKQNSREVEQKVDEKIDTLAPEQRLEALESQAEAHEEREAALTARDEAKRLADAAAAVKAERKSN